MSGIMIYFFNRKRHNLIEENKNGEIATQTLLGHQSNPGGKDIYNKCAEQLEFHGKQKRRGNPASSLAAEHLQEHVPGSGSEP